MSEVLLKSDNWPENVYSPFGGVLAWKSGVSFWNRALEVFWHWNFGTPDTILQRNQIVEIWEGDQPTDRQTRLGRCYLEMLTISCLCNFFMCSLQMGIRLFCGFSHLVRWIITLLLWIEKSLGGNLQSDFFLLMQEPTQTGQLKAIKFRQLF